MFVTAMLQQNTLFQTTAFGNLAADDISIQGRLTNSDSRHQIL
jgi:hypothetical protein